MRASSVIRPGIKGKRMPGPTPSLSMGTLKPALVLQQPLKGPRGHLDGCMSGHEGEAQDPVQILDSHVVLKKDFEN